MFELDPSLNHLDSPPERVVSIITSLNNPSVMTDLPEPEPTMAYICSSQFDTGNFGMWIYLYHQSSHVARIYSWSEGEISRDQFADVESMALDFAESMGFVMDNAQYRKMPPDERIAFYNSLPVFRADLDGFAAQEEAKEDPSLVDISEEMEEIDLDEIEDESDIELVEAEEEPGVKSVLDEYEAEHPGEAVDIENVNPFDDMQAVEPEPVEVEPMEVEPAEMELENIDEAEPIEELDLAEAAPLEPEPVEVETLEEIDIAGLEEEETVDPLVAQVVQEAGETGESLDETIAGLDELEGFGDQPQAADPFDGGDDTGDLDGALDSQFDSMVEHEDEEEIVEVVEQATPQDIIEEEVDFSEPEPEPEAPVESFGIDIDEADDITIDVGGESGDDLLSDEAVTDVVAEATESAEDDMSFMDEVNAVAAAPAAEATPEPTSEPAAAEEAGDFGIDFGDGGEEGDSFSVDVEEPEAPIAEAPSVEEPEIEPETIDFGVDDDASGDDALFGEAEDSAAPEIGDTTADIDFGGVDEGEEGESTASGWEAPEPPEPDSESVTEDEQAPAMASLEEELADEEPAAPPPGPALSPAEVADRLDKIGRLLSIW